MRAVTAGLLRAPGKARTIDVVDLLVWVYRDQKAHLVDGRGIGLYAGERAADHGVVSETTMTAVVGEVGRIGCMIDRIGRDPGHLHPAAEVVNEIVAGLGKPVTALLVTYGRRAEYPPAFDLTVELRPAWKRRPEFDQYGMPKKGSVRMILDGNDNVIGCRLEQVPSGDMVEDLQADYRWWHQGLVAVAGQCRRQQQRLGRLFVTGPTVPAEPWITRDARTPCPTRT